MKIQELLETIQEERAKLVEESTLEVLEGEVDRLTPQEAYNKGFYDAYGEVELTLTYIQNL